MLGSQKAQVIDLHALRNLVFPFPNNAWRSVVNCGGTFPPMYGTLQNAISNDFKNIVQVLSELEPTWDSDILDETAVSPLCSVLCHSSSYFALGWL